jgi:type IX secretion system PorP/SprF family membrane protein
MKGITKIIALVTLVVGMGTSEVEGQQLPQYSQFMLNDYVLNPAVAGSRPQFEARALNRSQWTGITDAPRTFTLSVQGPLKNPHIGLGGYLYTDNVGPTRRTGAQFSYTYHLFLNETLKLGLGVSMGAQQFAIDGSKIELAEDNDPALYSELNSQTVFDAKFGALLYADNFYVGFTFPQLLQNEIKLYDSVEQDFNKLEDHYYLMAGYTYEINEMFAFEPHLTIKYVAPTPVKWEAGARLHYDDMIWLGGSYRSNDAGIIMAGFEYREAITIGYSYDFTTSDLRNYADATHEIVLGFRFNQ